MILGSARHRAIKPKFQHFALKKIRRNMMGHNHSFFRKGSLCLLMYSKKTPWAPRQDRSSPLRGPSSAKGKMAVR